MKAVRRQTDPGLARLNRLAVQHLGFLDHSDNCAAHIVLARLIKSGHLRRLAADERATVLRTSASEAVDQLREDPWLQLPGADVIEKEKRLRAENCDVVHTVVDQILADGVMAVHRESELQLRSNTIDAGNQHG